MTGSAPAPAPPPARKPRRRMRALAALAATLLIATLPVLALIRYANAPGPLSGPPRTIEIAHGAGLRAIARHLERERIIAAPWLFTALAFGRGAEGDLKAGEYEFSAGVTPLQVIRTLEAGRPKAHFVTLKEGWTVAEMAEVIGGLGIVSKERLLALARDPAFAQIQGVPQGTLEGYCFPDTYALSRPMTEEAILKLLVSHFRKVFEEERRAAGPEAAAGLSDHDIVTLASIVEKETGVPEERPLIAAVFLNRIRKGMLLQSDPTVIYGIPDFDGNLTRRHLETRTPYNTYTESGLPPGPIANPGKAALHAVLNPADVDYLYFVSRNDGSHHF
ncbi:MAG: endolytic transglycosylase MltG, partial [Myxococcota bacterium]